MSAALKRPGPPIAAPLRRDRVQIDLGTAVAFYPPGYSQQPRAEEGVVIEVVPGGQRMRSTRVKSLTGRPIDPRTQERRYVVQCWLYRTAFTGRKQLTVVAP